MFLLIFFSIMFCLRILITVPSAILMALLFIHPSYVWMCKLDYKAEHWKIDAFEPCVLGEDPKSLLDCKEIKPVNPKGNQSWIFIGRTGYWSWTSNTLATWCEELTHWKRPWCWERLKAGEGDNWGWDGWMASLTQWTWVWASSRSWWWTESLVCCSPWGHKALDMTEWLNWTELIIVCLCWFQTPILPYSTFPPLDNHKSVLCVSESVFVS